MKCPKCGQEQSENTECIHCGIIFSKYEKRSKEEPEVEEQNLRSPATTPRNAPPSVIIDTPPPMTTGAFKISPSIRSIRDLCHGMSRMLRAGQSVKDSLKFLAEHSPKRLRIVVAEIIPKLEAGQYLSQTMVHHPHVFPPASIQLIRAAERTGHLSEAFLAIAEAFEARIEMRRHLIRSLLYPFFVLLMSIILLPLPELIAEDSSTYMTSVLTQVSVVVGTLFILFFIVPRILKFTVLGIKVRAAAWQLPWPATLYQANVRSILCRVFGRNLKSGLPVFESLESAALTTMDPHIQRSCTLIAEEIAQGEGLTQSVMTHQLLSPGDRLILTSGEETGELPGSLELLANRYAEKVQQGVRVLLMVVSALIALAIFGYVFLSIVDAYQGIYSQTDDILNGIGRDMNLQELGKKLDVKGVFQPIPR